MANQNSTNKKYWADGISLELRDIFNVVNNVFLCGIVGVFGIITNVINLIVFYKQGLNSTINISFFAMAMADLFCLTFQMWYVICVVPNFQQLHLPMNYMEVQYVIGGIPRELFARITCLITAYVTAERCLCIAFPLHVKQMITSKITTIVIIVIYLVPLSYGIPLFVVWHLDWHFYPDLNKTLFGAIATDHKDAVDRFAYISHAFLGVTSLVAVVVFTSILIRKLQQTRAWRQLVRGQEDKSDLTSKRDRSTVSMVVLIASILIVSYVPAVGLSVTTFFEPEFVVGGRYFDLYYILWAFALLFETINSSVNIFLYYNMSSKFRHNFREMFHV